MPGGNNKGKKRKRPLVQQGAATKGKEGFKKKQRQAPDEPKQQQQQQQKQQNRKQQSKQTKKQPQSLQQPKAKQTTPKEPSLEHLISNLAKQVAEPTAKSQKTKAERIEKRAAKQEQKQERRNQQNLQQQVQRASREASEKEKSYTEEQRLAWRTTHQSRKRLRTVAGQIKEIVKETKEQQQQQQRQKKASSHISPKPFEGFETVKKKRKVKKWDEENVQPRPKDYGGLGLALPSLFLDFEDPSFVRRLEDEFQEHIDGFFGKQRTKAMKKQLDGNMLWRKMSKLKQNKNQKVEGKKLADMTPDQRVEAMLKAGLL